ncbi:peptidase M16 [Reichenbachiella sp. 5M10]|uniref:M16 family metallopeptidase n=1 Tax=Reichenbachiella sp. 5M10 TaxID=1889772 RepID=UPI000C161A48|nr:pitrilysin family protein [Reichenbachiella sp. 5M10]PIB36248.1 peptidase M16 [Reichenbachiella sp. 5M10]
MKKILFVLSLLVSSTAFAQTKLIETVNKTGDEVIIPYAKYELANGLTLIVHEDHSDPLVHVDVTYHVGSAREELNKSGFAHFFEHMMFQGSDHVADEEHIGIVTEAGGTMNGTTNTDRTNYFETVPSNQLETMLWLESDRMGFFLDAVTQKKFEVQRATVKNEKGQNYDNRPYGRWSEVNAAALYPYGHPYSWLTIGRLEDLDRVDVNDLKKFFMRWYGPNNATLTVGGDVNTAEVVKLVEKYFGVIPRGPEVDKMKLDAPVVDQDRYVSYVDSNIRFPALFFTVPTVPRFHPDEAPLDCLSDILGSGRSSYFYKKFVLTQKAIQANVSHPCSELGGQFTMMVFAFPGQSLTDTEAEMRKAMKEFAENGVTDEDVEKFKAAMEKNIITGLESVSGKASQLASYETFLGDPNSIKYDLDRYLNFTKEDVMRVFNQYVNGKPGVIQSVVPNEETALAHPDNFVPQTEGPNPFPTTDYDKVTYKKPGKDNFDRSKRPPLGPNPSIKVPDFWTDELANGIKVIGTESKEVPTVTLQLTINGGHKMDAYAPTKSGLASLTAALMNESTENYSSEQIQEELRKIGSEIHVSSNAGATTMRISTLKKNLDRTLELADEILKNPAFTQEDFDRLKNQQIEGIKSSHKDPGSIADLVYDRLLYGDEHILSVPTEGIIETVETITVEDVRSFYSQYYSPTVSELVIVGDVSEQEIKGQLGFLTSWEAKEVKIPELPEAQTGSNTKIYLVDKAGAPQSEIRIGYMTGMTYDATGDYYKSYLMNFPLGGAFNSRINLNLREDKGWTYGARSYFYSTEEPGSFTALAGVKADATDSAVFEFMKEITTYRQGGISDEELSFMRNAIGQRDARNYETPSQKARFLARMNHYGLSEDFVDQQNKIIANVSKKELNKLAKKYLADDKFYIVVVGDAASNRSKLEALGYEVIDLDETGQEIKENKVDSKK